VFWQVTPPHSADQAGEQNHDVFSGSAAVSADHRKRRPDDCDLRRCRAGQLRGERCFVLVGDGRAQLAALIRRRRLALLVDPMNERVADIYREFGFKSVEGSDRLVLNFREFNRR
jgi:hypothetical protein